MKQQEPGSVSNHSSGGIGPCMHHACSHSHGFCRLKQDVSRELGKITKKHSWLAENTDDNADAAQRFIAGAKAADAAGSSLLAGSFLALTWQLI